MLTMSQENLSKSYVATKASAQLTHQQTDQCMNADANPGFSHWAIGMLYDWFSSDAAYFISGYYGPIYFMVINFHILFFSPTFFCKILVSNNG